MRSSAKIRNHRYGTFSGGWPAGPRRGAAASSSLRELNMGTLIQHWGLIGFKRILLNRVFPWLGGTGLWGSRYWHRRARRKLFGASYPFLEGSGQAGEQDRSVKLRTAFLPHAALKDGAPRANE